MNKRIICVAAVAAIVLSTAACGKNKAEPTKAEDKTITNVTVFTAQKTKIDDIVTYTGEIRASQETAVSAKASGLARSVNADIGDFVSAGTVLVKIDDTDYRLQYNQAKAAYNSALASYNSSTNGSSKQTDAQLETALASAQMEFDSATDNYNRQKTLYDMGAISKVEFDVAQSRLDKAQLSLSSAKNSYELKTNVINAETKATMQAAVDSARAAVDIAQNNLNYTTVTAPISGYIAAKTINKGQMVSPGSPLYTIKSTGIVDGEINVTESVIPYVKVGTKAKVSVKSAGLEGLSGSVSLVNPVKNAQTGMYTIRVSINNSDNKLKEGMFADITLVTNEAADAVVIPSEAIMQTGDELFIYCANGDTAVKSVITTGISNDEYTQILTGVNDGDKIIVSGKEYLSEKNNAIKIVEK